MRQNDWLHKIVAGVIIGIFVFMLKSQWDATEAVAMRLSEHTEESAKLYVPRDEFIQALNRLEDTIREAIRDAQSSGR